MSRPRICSNGLGQHLYTTPPDGTAVPWWSRPSTPGMTAAQTGTSERGQCASMDACVRAWHGQTGMLADVTSLLYAVCSRCTRRMLQDVSHGPMLLHRARLPCLSPPRPEARRDASPAKNRLAHTNPTTQSNDMTSHPTTPVPLLKRSA